MIENIAEKSDEERNHYHCIINDKFVELYQFVRANGEPDKEIPGNFNFRWEDYEHNLKIIFNNNINSIIVFFEDQVVASIQNFSLYRISKSYIFIPGPWQNLIKAYQMKIDQAKLEFSIKQQQMKLAQLTRELMEQKE